MSLSLLQPLLKTNQTNKIIFPVQELLGCSLCSLWFECQLSVPWGPGWHFVKSRERGNVEFVMVSVLWPPSPLSCCIRMHTTLQEPPQSETFIPAALHCTPFLPCEGQNTEISIHRSMHQYFLLAE